MQTLDWLQYATLKYYQRSPRLNPSSDDVLFVVIWLAEDVISFKNDVEAALKYMMKERSRTKDIAAIKKNFMDLLEDNFEEIFPKTAVALEAEPDDESRFAKKRGRHSDGDSPEEVVNKKQPKPVKAAESNAVASAKITYNQKVRSAAALIIVLYLQIK